jgi:hypothetical protein
MFRYLTQQQGLAPERVGAALWRDYQRGGRSDRPAVLAEFVAEAVEPHHQRGSASKLPQRQRRRLEN